MRFAALLFAFLLVSGCATAQTQQLRKDYTFIKHEYNRISYSADSSAFMRLFKKIGDIAEGKNKQLKIVHIGGSHVQAGLWSNAFVNAFQEKFITAGGGYFVFPFRIGKTNGQPYASSFSNGKWKLCRSIGRDFCLPLGMNALSLGTNDSANQFGVKISKQAACKYVNEIRVYHNFNPSYTFRLCNADSMRMSRGDNIAAGYTLFQFDMPVDSVCFALQRVDTVPGEFVLFGFSLDNTLAPGFYMAGLGANGASSSSFLKAENLVNQLASLKADLFVLSLGVNDTQSSGFTKDNFVKNYDTLISIIRKANPRAAILLTTTTDNYFRRKTPNKRTILAKEAAFQLMLTHDIAVWDLYSLMGGYRSMYSWYRAGLASYDKVHFNGKGYNIVGSLMFDAVIKAYEYSRHNQ